MMTTDTPPTMTAADSPAAPEGVPPGRWQRAVELIRTEARTAPSFWSLWCAAYKKHLRGFATGRTFYAAFDQYEQAGGQGRPYGRAPHARQDAADGPETINGASVAVDASTGQPGAGNGQAGAGG